MKKALIVSLAINIAVVLTFVGKRLYFKQTGKREIKPPNNFAIWNSMRTSTYAMLPIDSNDIVFVGNSLTEAFPVTEIYGVNVKNRGIGGNTTAQVLNRIHAIASRHPRKIFIEVGINDIVFGISIDTAFINYKSILELISRTSPNTKVIVQSVFPVGLEYAKFNETIDKLNQLLEGYCQSSGIEFININSEMRMGGGLDSSLSEDGLHLNAKGYQIWERAITEKIKIKDPLFAKAAD